MPKVKKQENTSDFICLPPCKKTSIQKNLFLDGVTNFIYVKKLDYKWKII